MNDGVINHIQMALADADRNNLIVTGIGLGHKCLCEFLHGLEPGGGMVKLDQVLDLKFKGIPVMPRPMRTHGVALLINSR